MAAFIELATPERYKVKGLKFHDYALDMDSLRGNFAILSRETGAGAGWVMQHSKEAITELGEIVKSHNATRRAEPA